MHLESGLRHQGLFESEAVRQFAGRQRSNVMTQALIGSVLNGKNFKARSEIISFTERCTKYLLIRKGSHWEGGRVPRSSITSKPSITVPDFTPVLPTQPQSTLNPN